MINKLYKILWQLESRVHWLFAKYWIRPTTAPKKHSLKHHLVVSLTSFPYRFGDLPLTIKCLLNQTIRPDEIILWIAESDRKHLTPEIISLQEKFFWFKIDYCEDLRSYTKLIPSLSKYPDSVIVTADDDIYYPSWWLKNLCDEWNDDLKTAIGYRAHSVTFNQTNQPKPYREWRHNISVTTFDDSVFLTGVGGILYPPSSLSPTTSDKGLFQNLCPSADDVWFFWMTRLGGAEIQKTKRRLNLISWPNTSDNGLAIENVLQNANDRQINAMIEKFGWPN